jgi:hypothetical protein
MPRKYRRSKRRQTASDAWIAWATGEKVEQTDPRFQEWLGFEYFDTDDEIAARWASDGHRVVDAWIADRPGTRPPLWWRHSAPEERRRLSGTGSPHANVCRRNGMPRFFIDVDRDDPPIFESQAAYLDRLGLFCPSERKRLAAKDFEPDVRGAHNH